MSVYHEAPTDQPPSPQREHRDSCDGQACYTRCTCGRGAYSTCVYSSCYDCFLDRRADYVSCILCGRWHSPAFDTCFKCRPNTGGRDDAAMALRQLILARDSYVCRQCGIGEGEDQFDPRLMSETRPATLQIDHIVPCRSGGLADEWNLQVLCGLHNLAKGSIWYVGCKHEWTRTRQMRAYFLIAPTYFTAEPLEQFRAEVEAYRATGTWDPAVHHRWRNLVSKGSL